MDRRRFSPSVDALDARLLLSLFHSVNTTPLANGHQKTLRIDRLASVLDGLEQGRVVPRDLVTPIQDDLRAVVGRLQPAAPAALTAAELQFRSSLPHASISTESAAGLSATFRNAIASTGAPQAVVDKFVADMDNLVKLDSNSPDPAILATNDYSTVLQTVLGVGRPITRPAVPSLAPADDTGAKGDHKTTVTQPHIVGSYDIQSTIQLLDQNDNVIGVTTTGNATAQYSVAPAEPLSVGRHFLRVRAIDNNGDSSPPSRPLTIIIYAPRVRHATATTNTPTGPLGL